jgi:hypothetical protein
MSCRCPERARTCCDNFDIDDDDATYLRFKDGKYHFPDCPKYRNVSNFEKVNPRQD